MTIELPVLRLGLAGFAAEQQQAVDQMLATAAGEATSWEIAEVDAADALWVNGARTKVTGPGRIRVAPGVPSGRALQFDLPDVDRPMAFAAPLPRDFQALCSFDLESPASMASALQQFEGWLAPLVAQFSLASHIAEHQSALGSGCYELRAASELLAVVDMQGAAAVRSTARPPDFDDAMWQRCRGAEIPETFVRTSLSQLMWQYATRTERDLLPRHYRTGLLYFRRAPRLPQSSLKDSHLLLMRELMVQPATLAELGQRCGMDESSIARELAALYFVGTITSNARRAAPPVPRQHNGDSVSPVTQMNFDSLQSEFPQRPQPARPDLTAPAPIRPDH